MTHTLELANIKVKQTNNKTTTTPTKLAVVSSLKARLRWAVERSGLSNRALSERAGLAPGSISQWLAAAEPNPTIDSLRAISKAADVSLCWFVTGHGSPTPYTPEAKGGLPAVEPAPPVIVTHSDPQGLVDAAFIPGKHAFLAGWVVTEQLRERQLELPAGHDPVQAVREWLTVASELHRKGEPITPMLLARELTSRVLGSGLARVVAEPTAPPPPMLVAAQQKEEEAERQRAGETKQRARDEQKKPPAQRK